jgi:hypothetical protein
LNKFNNNNSANTVIPLSVVGIAGVIPGNMSGGSVTIKALNPFIPLYINESPVVVDAVNNNLIINVTTNGNLTSIMSIDFTFYCNAGTVDF